VESRLAKGGVIASIIAMTPAGHEEFLCVGRSLLRIAQVGEERRLRGRGLAVRLLSILGWTVLIVA